MHAKTLLIPLALLVVFGWGTAFAAGNGGDSAPAAASSR